MKKTFIIIFFALLLKFYTVQAAGVCPAWATGCSACNYIGSGNSVTADTVAACDVAGAIENVSDGGKVYLPAGSVTWTTHTSGRAAVRINAKSVNIIGAGVGSTIITAGTAGSWTTDPQVPLYITSAAGKTVDISNLTFDGGSYTSSFGLVFLNGSQGSWRFHHMKFNNILTRAFNIQGGQFENAVIDNNNFIMKTQAIWLDQRSYGGLTYGDGSFQAVYTPGSADAIYIEDNIFNYVNPIEQVSKAVLDALGGARVVFRYNNVINSYLFTHGYETNGRLRGPRALEVYNNTFSQNPIDWNGPYAIILRGGTAIITNNTIDSVNNKYNAFVQMYIKRLENPCSGCQSSCDGSQSQDGNTIPIGYACRDQVGRGLDFGFTTSQALEPIYIWGNTLQGVEPMYHNNVPAGYITEGIEYILSNLSGFTPYTYPHPLRADVPPPDITPPSAPTGLAVE